MLGTLFKARVRNIAEPIALALGSLGVTPNVLTVVGFLLTVAVAVVIALGYLTWGGVLVLVVSAFDTLDGALARATGQVTRFGAFLDSSLDRYSDGVLYLGLLVYYAALADQLACLLAALALMGSFMVSYTRARAEGLGISCEVGILARPERIIILGIGLIIGYVVPALVILTVFANFTAGQRVVHVWRALKNQPEAQR